MRRCGRVVGDGDGVHDGVEPDQLLGGRLSLQRTEGAHVLALVTMQGGHPGYVSHGDRSAWHA